MIYNVVLVSGIQQSDSIIQTSILFQISHIGYHRILGRVPCATQYVLVGYVSYDKIVVYVCSSQVPDLPLLTHFPYGNHKFVFDVCKSISVL